jgi:hypothetical protein
MFYLAKIENGRMNVPEPEYLEAGAAIACGEALVLADGKLTKCGETVAPKYVAMGDAKAAGAVIPVCRVESNQVYDVPVSAAPTALKVGDKVTLDSDALGVTATTTSGVVTIVSLNGATKAGDIITVRI